MFYADVCDAVFRKKRQTNHSQASIRLYHTFSTLQRKTNCLCCKSVRHSLRRKNLPFLVVSTFVCHCRNFCDQLCSNASALGLTNVAYPKDVDYIDDPRQLESKFEKYKADNILFVIVVMDRKNSIIYCKNLSSFVKFSMNFCFISRSQTSRRCRSWNYDSMFAL